MSPEICRAELKRLINEKDVASCWLFTSLNTLLIASRVVTEMNRLEMTGDIRQIK